MSISGFFISMFMFPPKYLQYPIIWPLTLLPIQSVFSTQSFFKFIICSFILVKCIKKLPLQPCLLTPLPVCMPQFQETRAKEWGSSPRSFLRKMTICSFYPCTGKDERSPNYNLIVILRINFVWRLNFLNEQIIGVQSDSTWQLNFCMLVSSCAHFCPTFTKSQKRPLQ